jgi:hypothetical protein
MARSIKFGRKAISQPVPTPVLSGSGSSGPLCVAKESQASCHPEALDEQAPIRCVHYTESSLDLPIFSLFNNLVWFDAFTTSWADT